MTTQNTSNGSQPTTYRAKIKEVTIKYGKITKYLPSSFFGLLLYREAIARLPIRPSSGYKLKPHFNIQMTYNC